jgi:hypothetical protein
MTQSDYPKSIYSIPDEVIIHAFYYLIGYCKRDKVFRQGLQDVLDINGITL